MNEWMNEGGEGFRKVLESKSLARGRLRPFVHQAFEFAPLVADQFVQCRAEAGEIRRRRETVIPVLD
jgi:hypothetical protein